MQINKKHALNAFISNSLADARDVWQRSQFNQFAKKNFKNIAKTQKAQESKIKKTNLPSDAQGVWQKNLI